jgi:hypothetical protein
MSDLKKFLDKESFEINEETSIKVIDISDLGLFFWKRGGKQFVKYEGSLKDKIKDAKYEMKVGFGDFETRDFLDCLACLGEDKVKELIEKEGCLRNEFG